MKRLIFLFILLLSLILIIMSSCSKTLEDYDRKIIQEQTEEMVKNYQILVIDSCQYIKMRSHNEGYLAHKGNCSNPIHKK